MSGRFEQKVLPLNINMLVAQVLGKECYKFMTDFSLHEQEFGPDDNEIKAIQQDQRIKRRPKARNMLFTVMPGNDATYPAL